MPIVYGDQVIGAIGVSGASSADEDQELATIGANGSASHGRVLFDMTDAPGEDAIDGLKVDRAGNLYVCGPGGIWIVTPDGCHLGTLELPESPHNLAWGDADGRSRYVTALTSLYRIRLNIPGVRPR
jgi:gluconolactonase